MATSNKTDAISNGNRYESDRFFATASELSGKRFAATAVSTGNPCPGIFPEVQIGEMFWTSGKMPGQGLPVLTAVAADRVPLNSEAVAQKLLDLYLLPVWDV